MGNIIFNGEIIKREHAKVDIEDRGYQFGDGIYEVVRVYNGKPFALHAHIDRLIDSAKKIYLDIPYTKNELVELVNKLIKMEQAGTCNFYIQISRGVSVRNHVIPEEITAVVVGYLMKSERPVEKIINGVKAVLTEDTRWLHCDIKSLNLLGNILAKKKATDCGAFEAILHRGETVTEGSSANVWIVKNGKLFTHEVNHFILNGITRQRVIEISHKKGFQYEERAFTVKELLNADEVFITSTTIEIVPITTIGDKQISDGTPGEVTKQLQSLFVKEIEAECGVIQ